MLATLERWFGLSSLTSIIANSKVHNWGNYSMRVTKYGGRHSKSSVPKVNPWFLVVAENTQKIPRSRMACCCRAPAKIPVAGDAVEYVRWRGERYSVQEDLRRGGGGVHKLSQCHYVNHKSHAGWNASDFVLVGKSNYITHFIYRILLLLM
jgi:hypothetical protein